MLALTPAATAAVVSLLESPAAPDDAALRLSTAEASGGEAAIGLSLVSSPEPNDEVIVAGGADVEPETSDLLDDQLLDAEVDDEQIRFLLRPQSINGAPPATPE